MMNGAPSYLELRDLVRDPLTLRIALVQYALAHGSMLEEHNKLGLSDAE